MERVKSILIGMLAVVCVGMVVSSYGQAQAASSDWEQTEHNWNVQWGDLGLNIRNQFESDYDHVELSYSRDNAITPLTFAFRIAEEDGAREYRPIITQGFIDREILAGRIGLSLGHRIEFRHNVTDGVDSNWRYRTISKISLKLLEDEEGTARASLWAKVQPRWEFGEGKPDDFWEIADVKNQVGLNLKIGDGVNFSPYVEYLMDGINKDFERKEVLVGTALTFKY